MSKQQFLWGSATAAYQCEGAWNEDGKGEGEWDAFCHSPKNDVNPVSGDEACDFYHRYEEDIRMMKEGGQNTYRFSIAWSRILPHGVGEVNQKGIDFYNKVIDTCLKYEIVPNVTLFHYDLPNALALQGGWENRATVDAFAQYAKICFEAFGDRVPLWSTINEPKYYSYCAYIVGNYPPNVKDFNRRTKVAYYLMLGSAKAIRLYHDMKCPGKIGVVHASGNVEIRADKKDDPAYQQAYRWADLFFNKWVTDVCIKGGYASDLYDKLKESKIDLSFIEESDAQVLKEGTVDYIGLNIYSRNFIKPWSGGETCVHMNNQGKGSNIREGVVIKGWFETDYDPNVRINDWGREIYPKCMYDELKEIQDKYGDIPIYITENGHGCYEELDEHGELHDDERIEIVGEFIDWMLKAKEEGVNVCGYYMWSTMDLYSWINGYRKRYGLVYVDYDNDMKRTPKKSWYWYRNFIQAYQKEKGE